MARTLEGPRHNAWRDAEGLWISFHEVSTPSCPSIRSRSRIEESGFRSGLREDHPFGHSRPPRGRGQTRGGSVLMSSSISPSPGTCSSQSLDEARIRPQAPIVACDVLSGHAVMGRRFFACLAVGDGLGTPPITLAGL